MSLPRRSPDETETLRESFRRRMVAADSCPIDGPCGESPCVLCSRGAPHPCIVGRHTARGVGVQEAVALALDSVRYPGPGETPLTPAATEARLAGSICRDHVAAAEPFFRRPHRRRR